MHCSSKWEPLRPIHSGSLEMGMLTESQIQDWSQIQDYSEAGEPFWLYFFLTIYS